MIIGMSRNVTAEKTLSILLRDESKHPVGTVLRIGKHWVFHELKEMGDDEIIELFGSTNDRGEGKQEK